MNDYYSTLKKKKVLLFATIWNEPGGYYAKWNKPERGRQILHGITYMWIGGKGGQKVKLIEMENMIAIARGWSCGDWGLGIERG